VYIFLPLTQKIRIYEEHKFIKNIIKNEGLVLKHSGPSFFAYLITSPLFVFPL